MSAEIARKVMRRRRFDNDTLDKVTKLVLWHECPWECNGDSGRKVLCRIGHQLFELLLNMRRADVLAQST